MTFEPGKRSTEGPFPLVLVVHGKGQGVLRKAVHDYLRRHPLVSSFRIGTEGEGDSGVTIVKFVSRQ